MDRENYAAGEIIWFNCYIYSEYLPGTISTTIFVEFINHSSATLVRKVSPVVNGSSSGQIELPDTLTTGYYTIRAFTLSMLNQPDYLYNKRIFIYGKKAPVSPVSETAPRMEFFPEGGNFVVGLGNPVAFKLTNANGLPLNGKGVIKTSLDKTVAEFSTYHDGMGMFELAATAGESYYAILEGSDKRYNLPVSAEKGIVFSLMNHPQGSFFDIQENTDPAQEPAYMIGHMQHQVVFRQELKATRQGVINTQKLHSGILLVTVFNNTGQPLAERICFVNNKEYRQDATLITDTLSFAGKGKNRFRLSLKDSVDGSFSISVYDPEYSISKIREENILSSMLLTSDLKGYIHNPSYYFSETNDSLAAALDLVMMTNGWRRFKWNDIVTTPVPAVKYQDVAYITLRGKATLRDSKRPFTEKPLLLVVFHADSTRNSQIISTDKDGNFVLPSMVFYGKSRLFFSDIRGKKSQFIDVHLSADSLTRNYTLPGNYVYSGVKTTVVANEQKLKEIYDLIAKESGLMLEGITLKTRKKTPLQELEEKYAKGMFAGMAEKTIDLVNSEEPVVHANIFDYLQLRVPGLNIATDGFDYTITYRQNSSLSSMGVIPMVLFLDEVETDPAVIATIPGNQIAMVKVYSTFVGASGNGAGGALSIYTKKDADINHITRSDMLGYTGYSIIKEFYAPDYSVNKTSLSNADNRITLDWRPLIFIKGVNPFIPFTFYNNDRSKSYKVVVEGMTSDGKFLMLEKTISAKGF